MNLSSIDLNLLLILETVLEEKSVARAADRLNLTQPAVSNALARLRSSLGDALLVRRGRGVVPTPRALELWPELQASFGSLRRALGEQFDPATTRRRFVLALSEVDQACSAPDIAMAVRKRMPHAMLQIVSLETLAASDGLANGAVDAAMIPGPAYPEHPGLHGEALYEDEAALLVHKTYTTARGMRLSVAQFNALRHVDAWLVLGKPSVGHRIAEDFFAQHGLKRDVALVVPTFHAAAMAAASSDLASVMPRRLAERFQTMLSLHLFRLPGPPLRFQQRLIWHERTHGDPGAILLRELISEVARRPWEAMLRVPRYSRKRCPVYCE